MRRFIYQYLLFFFLCGFSHLSLAQPGGAFDFDGVNDYFQFRDKWQNELGKNFTIEFWVRSTDTNRPGAYIASKNSAGDQYGIIYDYVNDMVEFYSANGHWGDDPRTGSAIPLADMNWHHIAYTYDEKTFMGYKDGVRIFSIPKVFLLKPLGGYDWFIGSAFLSTGCSKIQIDEFRLWNRAVCIAELNNNMNCQLTGNESGLMAYYDFNVGTAGGVNSGSSVPDKTPFANNLINGPLALNGPTSNFVTGAVSGSCSVFVPAAINITGPGFSVCSGTPVALSATTGFTKYVWSTGDSISSISVKPGTTTSYIVSGIASNSCISKDTFIVNVNGGSITLSQVADTLKTNFSYTPTFQWLDCNNSKQAISGATNSWYKGNLGGSYALTTTYIGCKDTSGCYTIKKAGSMDFDGVNDYIRLNDNAATRITNNFTIEFWIKLNVANQTNKYILTRNNASGQWAIIYGFVSNTLELFTSGGGVTSGNPRLSSRMVINDTVWHHVAYAYDGTVLRGYIDGTLIIANTTAFALAPMAGVSWAIGSSGAANYTNMKMDELRVWNKRLTGSEIQSRMNCELDGNESGLVAYYNFNSGYVNADNKVYNSLIDNSPTANNGTLNNIALLGRISNWSDGKLKDTCSLLLLPVELLSFTCKTQGRGVNQLNWETGSGDDISSFEIENSTDGKSFIPIGKVDARLSDLRNNKYTFNINNNNSKNYYRLKMLERDGKYSYSQICYLVSDSDDTIIPSVYPNPANDLLTIEFSDFAINSNEGIVLTDIAGKQVACTAKIEDEKILLDIAGLKEGLYFVSVRTTNRIYSLKFVKSDL